MEQEPQKNEPVQVNQEVLAYIKTRQEGGANLLEISNELKGAGWEAKDIGEAMQSVGASMQEKTAGAPAQVKEPVVHAAPLDPVPFYKREIATRLGTLIILFFAVIQGSWMFWYAFTFEVPEVADVGPTVAQLQARRNVEGNAMTTASSTVGVTNTISILSSDYEIKADGVYYQGVLIMGASTTTFEYIGGNYSKDRERVYFKSKTIEGADPETFRYTSDSSYKQDELHVYLENKQLIESDSATFQYIAGGYSKDKSKVYFFDKVVLGADPATFQYLGSSDRDNDWYAKDKISVYINGKKIQNASSATFQYLGGNYSKDTKHVYWGEEGLISDVDPVTFEYIDAYYAKDKNYVYWTVNRLIGADSATFQYVGGFDWYAKDKLHVYKGGIVNFIKGANPANCTATNLEGCKGTQ